MVNWRGQPEKVLVKLKQTLLNLDIQTRQSLSRQIADQVRKLIQSGELPVGTKLPNSYEMAEGWNTSFSTVHAAMSQLENEGLLERAPRRGTFVRSNRQQLTAVGIFLAWPAIDNEECAFYRALRGFLIRELQEVGLDAQCWYGEGPEESALPRDLLQAAWSRQIQGLIVPLFNKRIQPLLSELDIPAATWHANPRLRRYHSVRHDMSAGIRTAVDHLRDQGCKSVGLISSSVLEEEFQQEDGQVRMKRFFYRDFVDAVADCGLKTSNAWVHHREPLPGPGHSLERYGFESFIKLWKSKEEKPDGLFVYDDITARGVVSAVQHLRVDVPEQLQLVLHQHKEMSFPCPLPHTALVTSVEKAARTLVKQLTLAHQGNQPAVRILKHSLEERAGFAEKTTRAAGP